MKEQLPPLTGPEGAPIPEISFDATAVGELYLFHTTDPHCPSEGSLGGVVDRIEERRIRLESSSEDLRLFRLWHPLPAIYRYGRQATRAELRDYFVQLACFECGRS